MHFLWPLALLMRGHLMNLAHRWELVPSTPQMWLYAAACVLAVLVAWYWGLDRHQKGDGTDTYFQPWDDTQVAPDKVQHAAISFALMLISGALMPIPQAALVTLFSGIAWEIQQLYPREPFKDGGKEGYASWRDVVADTSGIGAGIIVHAVMFFLIRWVDR